MCSVRVRRQYDIVFFLQDPRLFSEPAKVSDAVSIDNDRPVKNTKYLFYQLIFFLAHSHSRSDSDGIMR